MGLQFASTAHLCQQSTFVCLFCITDLILLPLVGERSFYLSP